MQVARKHIPSGAPVVGVDLVSIKNVSGCVGVEGDITKDGTVAELKRVLGGRKVDCVLNDGSPNMGAAWLQDAYSQSELTLAALSLAVKFLGRGGAFVSKVFRSVDYTSLIFVMNQLFARVNSTKPSASRTESAEIYVVAMGYKDPGYVDPRLLNPRFVFQELGNDGVGLGDGKKGDLALQSVLKDRAKKSRERQGYEDGVTNLYKEVELDEFIQSDTPVAILALNNAILLPDAAHPLMKWSGTTEEIKECLRDTKQLGRKDFKLLLKYRTLARAHLKIVSGAGEDEDGEKEKNEDAVEKSKEDVEAEDLDEEEATALGAVSAREKRKKRKERKRKAALQRKIDMKILSSDPQALALEEDLFDVRTVMKQDPELENIAEDTEAAHLADSEDDIGDDEDSKEKEHTYGTTPVDPAEMKQEEFENMEAEADNWYQSYLNRRNPDKAASAMPENGVGDEAKENREETENETGKHSDQDLEEQSAAPILPKSKKAAAAAQRDASLWFAQDVFAKVDDKDDDEEEEEEEKVEETRKRLRSEVDAGDAEQGEDTHAAARKAAQKRLKKEVEKAGKDGDFDTVPQDEADEEDESDDDTVSFRSLDYDTDEKAEMVAIGKAMRSSKKRRLDILDDAYNRYVFDDPDAVPRWFAETEGAFRERPPPVTKAEVAECKEYIKSLSMAPRKKEAEAKARKKKRVEKNMESARRKAEKVAEQTGMTGDARMRAIDKLYKAASRSSKNKKPAKNYVVVKSGGSHAARRSKNVRGGRTKLVDSRMKADARGMQKKNKGKKRKGGRA